jgi:hypothetical protein
MFRAALFTSKDNNGQSECEHNVENNLWEDQRSKWEALQSFIMKQILV